MIVNAIFLVLITGCMHGCMAWTIYERDFELKCPDGQYVSGFQSEYNNKNDRIWEISCSKGLVSRDCVWSAEKTEVAGITSYECPALDDLQIITGINSRFIEAGFRIWRFKCCKRDKVKKGINCQERNAINRWGMPMSKTFQRDRALVKIIIMKGDTVFTKKDTIWGIKTCQYPICTVSRLKLLTPMTSSNEAEKIIGVAVDQTCSSTTSTLKLYRTDTLHTTLGLSIGNANEFNFGSTVTVGAETSVKFLGNGVTATLAVEASLGGAVTAETVNSNETTIGSEDSSGKDLAYTGPGAAIIIGTVTKHILKADEMNVEVLSTCSDGTESRVNKIMKMSGATYGKAFYTSRYAAYKPNKCDQTTENCLKQIDGGNAYRSEEVFQKFTACIGDKAINGIVSRR